MKNKFKSERAEFVVWLWIILVVGAGTAAYLAYRTGDKPFLGPPSVETDDDKTIDGTELPTEADGVDFTSPITGRVSEDAPNRAELAARLVLPELAPALRARGLYAGDPIFIRIFKADRELELWVFHREDRRFRLFKTYLIEGMSGDPGPKLAEGDRQAPEGFYVVTRDRMNPNSRYHLSFNLGYPNDYDRDHGRTGSYLMVHGGWVSAGCFAMTDYGIEEIYSLADAALSGGQHYFRVHIFPFRMTDTAMNRVRGHKWFGFWENLREGYDYFERQGIPPDVSSVRKRYAIADPAPVMVE